MFVVQPDDVLHVLVRFLLRLSVFIGNSVILYFEIDF